MPITLQAKTPAELLRRRITEEGPVTYREWMETALYHPSAGYYNRPREERWGRGGDYRTSPERSSLFAATFARYFARLYQDLGSPDVWSIVEAGAGGGHFAAGILRTLQWLFPPVFTATRYVIDELSSNSRARAITLLAQYGDKVSVGRIAELEPIQSGIVFSNELFDSFPVHRVTMLSGKLREFYVGLDENGDFAWISGPPSTPSLTRYLQEGGIQLWERQTAEINLELEPWLRRIAGKLAEGYLITVDYGADSSELYDSAHMKGTLRAFYRHRLVENVLERCGEQDITTTIDWSLVKRIGAELGLRTVDFQRQDQFLLRAGLLDQLEHRLSQAVDDGERLKLSSEAREMILPSGMAASFQVLVQEKRAIARSGS